MRSRIEALADVKSVQTLKKYGSTPTNGDLVPSLPYDFRDDSRQLATDVEQWGPRPVGE